MKKNSAALMRKTRDEMDQLAVDMEEVCNLSSGVSKGDDDDDKSVDLAGFFSSSSDDDDDKSVDLAGFFSSDDDDEEEILDNITDSEDVVGDDEPDHFYISGYGSDSFKANNCGHAGVKHWKRRSCPDPLNRNKPFTTSAAGASVMSGYPSPPHGNTKSHSQPIDIFYGGSECRDVSFNSLKKGNASRPRRNLFQNKEDWRDKAWQRKRDQVLSEEIVFSDHCSDHSQSSKTAQESGGEETTNNSLSYTPRTRSFTNVDLDELKGCLDLGFGFNYEEMPELSNTLPALELCYVMGQKFQDDNHHKASPVSTLDNADSPRGDSHAQSPIANWIISSPGDHPQQVKERLKVWAQAVACTVRLCSS